MAGKVSRGWALVKQSWSVLRLDKELMVFPVLSFLACLVVMASFASPLLFVRGGLEQFFGEGDKVRHLEPWQRAAFYGGLFLFYFVSYLVVVFFNTALVWCALIRFRGGDPTVGDGLRAATARLPQIAAWALVASTVGMVLRTIEERVSFVGKLIVGFLGLAWSVVTYLVVPVLAVERLGPFATLRRSVELLRETWGEGLVGQFSMSALSFLLMLPAIVLVVALIVGVAVTQSVTVGVTIGALAVLYIMLIGILFSTLQQIFLAAAYLYAAEARVPAGFSEDFMKSAFVKKGKKQ